MNQSIGIGFQIMGAAVPILSFILVYTLMRTSSAILGKLMNNNPAKGIGDRLRKDSEKRGEKRDDQRGTYGLSRGGIRGKIIGGAARGKARESKRRETAAHNRKIAEAQYISDIAKENQGDNRFARQLGFGSGREGVASAVAQAIQVNAELKAKEVSAQGAIIKELNLTDYQKAELAMGRDAVDDQGRVVLSAAQGLEGSSLRMAAQQAVVQGGDAAQINRVVDHIAANEEAYSTVNSDGSYNKENALELNNFADALERSSSRPSWIQAGDIIGMRKLGTTDKNDDGTDKVKDGVVQKVSAKSSSEMIDGAIKANVFSPEKMAQLGGQESGVLKDYVEKAVATRRKQMIDQGVPEDQVYLGDYQNIIDSAQRALADQRIEPRLGKARGNIQVIANIKTTEASPMKTTVEVEARPRPDIVTGPDTGGRGYTQTPGGLYIPHNSTLNTPPPGPSSPLPPRNPPGSL